MTPKALFEALAGLTGRINQALQAALEEDKGFFGEVGVYSLLGGGKRLRPLVYCLCVGALGHEADEDAVKQSCSFELLHMATLMHDDIIDQSDTRRGRESVHRVFGIPETVMAADYLVAKAGIMTLAKSNLDTSRMMIELLRDLSLGELAELRSRRDPELSYSAYIDIIYRKTAALLETVGKTAASLSKAPPEAALALSDYGRLLGLAFQIVDDVLDYQDEPGPLGKPVGLDLAEGRITLPFIKARDSLRGDDLTRLIELGVDESLSPSGIREARALVEKGGGIEAAMAEAGKFALEAKEALGPLPPSADKDLLAELAAYPLSRDR